MFFYFLIPVCFTSIYHAGYIIKKLNAQFSSRYLAIISDVDVRCKVKKVTKTFWMETGGMTEFSMLGGKTEFTIILGGIWTENRQSRLRYVKWLPSSCEM